MLIDLYCAQRYYDILRIRLLLTDGGGCSLLQNRHCRAMERFLYFDNGCEGENQNQNQNQNQVELSSDMKDALRYSMVGDNVKGNGLFSTHEKQVMDDCLKIVSLRLFLLDTEFLDEKKKEMKRRTLTRIFCHLDGYIKGGEPCCSISDLYNVLYDCRTYDAKVPNYSVLSKNDYQQMVEIRDQIFLIDYIDRNGNMKKEANESYNVINQFVSDLERVGKDFGTCVSVTHETCVDIPRVLDHLRGIKKVEQMDKPSLRMVLKLNQTRT